MGYLNPTNDFRWILPSETDANSPLSEELMSQIRNNLEAATMDVKYTGIRFSVDSVDSTSTLTVSKVAPGDRDWLANEFVGLNVTFLQPSTAIGLIYTVVSNTALTGAGTSTLVLSTSGTIDLPNDGVAAGDEGYFMYVNTGVAHTHNGTDSANLAVSTLLYSIEKNQGPGATLSIGQNFVSEPMPIIFRPGMTGIRVFVNLQQLTSANDPESTAYRSWADYNDVTFTLETASSGNTYTLSTDNGFQSRANTGISGSSLTLTNAQIGTIVNNANNRNVRIKVPDLQIGTLGLSADEGFTAVLRVNFAGTGISNSYGWINQLNVYSVY